MNGRTSRMRGLSARSRAGLVAALTLTIAVFSATVVLTAAGIPQANGTIDGCYNGVTGDLRVVSSQTQCKPNELALSWSQTGPTGPTGPTGAIGPRGLTWRGAYANASSYAVDDAVEYVGSSYVAIAAVPSGCSVAGGTGNTCSFAFAPTNTAYWSLLAKKGDVGTTGSQGPKGDGLVWRGTYDSTKSYAANDAVQYLGSSYVAVAPLTPANCSQTCLDQNAPGLNAAWQLLARQGEVALGRAREMRALAEEVSNALEISRYLPQQVPPAGQPELVVLHLALPNGKYAVFAQAVIINDNNAVIGDNARHIECQLKPDNQAFGSIQSNIGMGQTRVGGFPDEGMINLQVAYTVTSTSLGTSTGVDFACRVKNETQDPSNVQIWRARLIAIEVSSLTHTTLP